jgi:hypothetical protein
VTGQCEHGIGPLGSIKDSNCRVAERLLAAQEELCSLCRLLPSEVELCEAG